MQAEDAILILKEAGADQMSTIKVLIEVFDLRLREADDYVQNSEHWKEFKAGNDALKEMWLKD